MLSNIDSMSGTRGRAGRRARTLASCWLALTALAGVGAGVASAEVVFTPTKERPLADVVKDAARDQRVVMLVITQPDWCPPCIRLDRDLLRNPKAADIRSLTKGWVVLEVHGYEHDPARDLALQQIEFIGTPTTLLIQMHPGDTILRDGDLLGAIAGYPEDYVARLRRAVDRNDDTEALASRAKHGGSLEDWMAFARRCAERGQGARAKAAYRMVLGVKDAAAIGLSPDSLASLQKTAFYRMTTEVTQSVEKDHPRAAQLLDTYVARYPDEEANEDVAYARAYSLLKQGNLAEAQLIIDKRFLASGALEDLETFLYLAFRAEQPDVLELAVTKAQEGLATFKSAEGPLSAALGRVYRALGQNKKAAEAFHRAVERTKKDDPAYVIYEAEYAYARGL